MQGWRPVAGSADADLLDELPIIRPRSRDIDRNNGWATGARQTLLDNIVGHQLRLASKPDIRLLGWDRETAKEWSRALESSFATWANVPEECDAGGALTVLGQTLQGLGGWVLNGEGCAIPQ
jgi:capsid protein